MLSKRFDKFSSVVNIISEIERNVIENVTESAFELTMGLAYDISNNIAVGIEFRNDRNYSNIYKKEENQASFVGPTISIRGELLYFVVNFLTQVSGGPALTKKLDLDWHEKYELRTILGIGL